MLRYIDDDNNRCSCDVFELQTAGVWGGCSVDDTSSLVVGVGIGIGTSRQMTYYTNFNA